MNLVQLQYVLHTFKEALHTVRHGVGRCRQCRGVVAIGPDAGLERRIQNAQSLIGNEINARHDHGDQVEYKEGCVYLFIVDGAASFVYDDWVDADNTRSYLIRQDIRFTVKAVERNPEDALRLALL